MCSFLGSSWCNEMDIGEVLDGSHECSVLSFDSSGFLISGELELISSGFLVSDDLIGSGFLISGGLFLLC